MSSEQGQKEGDICASPNNNVTNFPKEGYMIVPEFLDPAELEMIRNVCDVSVAEVEREMRSKGLTKNRSNTLGKKYFINNVLKRHPELKSIVFKKKIAKLCKATIGDTAYLHNEQFVVKMTDTDTSFAWKKDIMEENDMAEIFPEKASELKQKLATWRSRTKVQMPRVNPEYQPLSGSN
jgi:hypothetical protein